MKLIRQSICAFFGVMCLFFLCFGARAATFTVANTADSGAGSLRQAIADADAAASDDVIRFDAGVFDIARTIALTSGELTITGKGKLIINGTNANLLTVGGSGNSRVLRVAGGDVTMADLTVTDGSVAFAGGIYVESAAILTLNRVVVRNNAAVGANGVGSGASGSSTKGGGIQVDGTLNLNDSTVRDNTAQGGSGANGIGVIGLIGNPGGSGGGANSGGIYVNGTLNMNNSIVRANTVRGGGGGNGVSIQSNNSMGGRGGDAGSAFGGGVYVNSSAVTGIKNSLLSENTALGGNGGGGNTTGSVPSTRGGDSGKSGAGGGGGVYASGVRRKFPDGTYI